MEILLVLINDFDDKLNKDPDHLAKKQKGLGEKEKELARERLKQKLKTSQDPYLPHEDMVLFNSISQTKTVI